MTFTAVKNTMLYCPKCQQTYEEGVQRFCPNDDARLLPASSRESANQTSGVFTNVLNRQTGEEGDLFSSAPKFSQIEPAKYARPTFRAPASKMFKSDSEFELELELEPSKIESKPLLTEPLPQNIKPGAISSLKIPSVEDEEKDFELAVEGKETLLLNEKVEDEKEDLIETPAFEFDASQGFIGQTINNRYQIVEQLGADENAESYLAEDKTGDKKVVVMLLFNETDDSFANKIFAEERASLSQISHANIANVLDSGELPSGKEFLITEHVEGKTVKDYLEKNGQFNALRTARIIRQAADGLSEAHQNGILHRNLKPENIVLTVDENGMERVKLTNFGAPKEKLDEKNLLYKSPEQVEGKVANYTSDGFSLAVIAHQMLTNRLPFNASSVGDLLKAQREGLKLRPSNLRDDLPASADKVLEKALSFNPFDRYEKVREFGDEFFGEIIANAPLEADEEIEEFDETPIEPKQEKTISAPALTAAATVASTAIKSTPVSAEISKNVVQEPRQIDSVKATEDLAWEKRSPKPLHEAHPRRNLFSFLGVAGLLIALLGVWYYFINRPSETLVNTPTETANQNAPTTETSPIVEANVNAAPSPEEIEAPPLPRTIKAPADSVFFQNSKENLRGDALRNFLGFSLYYPKNWKVNKIVEEKDSKARSKFLDVSKDASSGTPIEQFLVSYYNSKGTFKADAEIFQSLVNETNTTLKKIVPNYEMVSKGEITINGGWHAYEVKFKGTGKTENGENITLWGRRMFIPTAIRGTKNGYVITMLATSLSKEVKGVQDVGVKGDLSSILETFEPNQSF